MVRFNQPYKTLLDLARHSLVLQWQQAEQCLGVGHGSRFSMMQSKREPASDNNLQKQLTNDQLSDLIFKELKIPESDCIGLDYFYSHKEVELKEGVDLTP